MGMTMNKHDLATDQNILTRLTPRMLSRYSEAGIWGRGSIFEIVKQHAARAPEQIAFIDRGLVLHYGELIDLSERFATHLTERGLQPGDRVAAWMSSRCELAVLLLACSRGGFIICPSLHRSQTVSEVRNLINKMDAKAIIVEKNYGADSDNYSKYYEELCNENVKLFIEIDCASKRNIFDLSNYLNIPSNKNIFYENSSSDIVYIAFTSGTTSDPKGVLHSSDTLIANASSFAKDWEINSESVVYTLGPLSHNLGFGALVLALFVGCKIVVHDLPRGSPIKERLLEVGATFLFGVPAHAMDFLKELEENSASDIRLPLLSGFRVSGAAVPSWVVERLAKVNVPVQSGYGMTEAGSHNYTLPNDPIERISQTSGRPCQGYELKIFSIDDWNKELDSGKIGHIGGRGASLMMGYFDDQKATENSFNNEGWFMTGDLGYLDESGYLTITGRIKDIIIRGGHNINPQSIERIAAHFPGVDAVAVIGIPDERLGERICIAIQPSYLGSVEARALISYLHKMGLSKFEMPEFFLEVEKIPVSASGKILKRLILPAISSGKLTPKPMS